MDYYEILKTITDGLTGNWEKDLEYLNEQSEFYKTHELAPEILRGIGRLICDIMPPERMEEINLLIRNNNLYENAVIEEAEFLYTRGNYEKARAILENFLKEIETEDGLYNMFPDDSVSEYHNFRNILEDFVYCELNKPEKKVRNIRRDFDRVYLDYGTLLFELKHYDESEKALKKAIEINPMNLDAWFELSEVMKVRHEWNEYQAISKHCLTIAYSSKAVGRCYRNLGFYCIEMESFELAIALYHASLVFDPESQGAMSELMYIQEITGKPTPAPKSDVVEKMFAENDIQFGPSKTVMGLALEIGQQAEKEMHYGIARFLYSVLYDLTGDKKAKDMMDRLPAGKAP